jgi:hypothetical protein
MASRRDPQALVRRKDQAHRLTLAVNENWDIVMVVVFILVMMGVWAWMIWEFLTMWQIVVFR